MSVNEWKIWLVYIIMNVFYCSLTEKLDDVTDVLKTYLYVQEPDRF